MILRQSAQQEELDQMRIELRRKQHAERLQRIMNEKQRTIGNDYKALDKQIQEKKEQKAREKAEDDDYSRRFLEEQRVLGRIGREEQRIRNQIVVEDNKFREEYQQPSQSREYDIWRKDYKQVQPPVRESDNDPWLSVSGGQKYDGEDLAAAERKKRQREQLLNWQTQQMLEKDHKKALEVAEQRAWEQKYIENDQRMVEIENMKIEARKDVQHRQDEENYRAMCERRRIGTEEQQDDLQMNASEINGQINGPVLCESRDVKTTVGRFGQKPTQDWKGMSDEEKLAVIEERRSQMLENQKRKVEEAERERKEEAERLMATREAIRKERQENRSRQQGEVAQAVEYQKIAEEHKQQEEIMNKEVYGENQPKDEFWNYFGKSHR